MGWDGVGLGLNLRTLHPTASRHRPHPHPPPHRPPPIPPSNSAWSLLESTHRPQHDELRRALDEQNVLEGDPRPESEPELGDPIVDREHHTREYGHRHAAEERQPSERHHATGEGVVVLVAQRILRRPLEGR